MLIFSAFANTSRIVTFPYSNGQANTWCFVGPRVLKITLYLWVQKNGSMICCQKYMVSVLFLSFFVFFLLLFVFFFFFKKKAKNKVQTLYKNYRQLLWKWKLLWKSILAIMWAIWDERNKEFSKLKPHQKRRFGQE